MSKDSQPMFFGRSLFHSRLPAPTQGSDNQMPTEAVRSDIATDRDHLVAEANSKDEFDDSLFEGIVSYQDKTFDSKIMRLDHGMLVSIKQRNGDINIIRELDVFECRRLFIADAERMQENGFQHNILVIALIKEWIKVNKIDTIQISEQIKPEQNDTQILSPQFESTLQLKEVDNPRSSETKPLPLKPSSEVPIKKPTSPKLTSKITNESNLKSPQEKPIKIEIKPDESKKKSKVEKKVKLKPVEADDFFDAEDEFGPIKHEEPKLHKDEVKQLKLTEELNKQSKSSNQGQSKPLKTIQPEATKTPVVDKLIHQPENDFFDDEEDPFEKFEKEDKKRKEESSRNFKAKTENIDHKLLKEESKNKKGFNAGPPANDFDLDDEFESPDHSQKPQNKNLKPPNPRAINQKDESKTIIPPLQANLKQVNNKPDDFDDGLEFDDFENPKGKPVPKIYTLEDDSFEKEMGKDAAAKMENTGRSVSGFAGFKATKKSEQPKPQKPQLDDYGFDDEF